jgi:hypothetical protein
MSNIAIYNGTSTYVSGSSTPFKFYDNDSVFRIDAVNVAQWCAQRLGYPLVEVELQSGSFFTAFEEAVTTYGNEVYQWKVRENYLNLEGSTTGSAGYTLNNQVITPNLGSIIRVSETYASEAGAGGYTTWYTGSFTLKNHVQDYDVAAQLKAQGITGSIEIKKIFYESPPAIVRYFDPYAGTGTGIQSLLETFGFGQFSPGINFLLMPIYFDVQKVQAIQLNDQIRKAAFSFDIHNNHVRIFPIPTGVTEGYNDKMFIHYIIQEERNNPVTSNNAQATGSLITNVSNVPYTNPVYVQINSIGRQWIRQYTLCLVKEMLAYVRGKYSTVPIPGSEVTLNQQDLLTDARAEKIALLEQLRAMLDQTSRKIQLEQQATEVDFAQKQLANVPLPIYFF